MAGAIGIDPGPLSLRELTWMYVGTARMQWDHTANIVAAIINAHSRKGKGVDPNKLNPYRVQEFRRRREPDAAEREMGWAALKSLASKVRRGSRKNIQHSPRQGQDQADR